MSHLFAGLIGKTSALPMFYSVQSNHVRATLLRRTVFSANLSKAAETEAYAIIDKFQSLNNTRNLFIHSNYGTIDDYYGDGRDVIGISEYSAPERDPKGINMGKIRPINGSEIRNHCNATVNLRIRALEFSAKELGYDPRQNNEKPLILHSPQTK